MPGKYTAVYPRVSSRKQDEASQLPDLERWVAAQDKPVKVKWFRDKFTGKSMDRPGWNKLEAALRAGEVETIVVWRLDRLGRTAKGLTALFDELTARKINLVSLKDGLDLSTPAGRLMANVLASVAQYETEVRHERITAGLAVAKENGVKLGRPAGVKTRVKVTREQEKYIRELKGRGEKVAAIARTTGLSRPTIYSVLAGEGRAQ